MKLLVAVLLAVAAPRVNGQPPNSGPGPCQRFGGSVINDCTKCSGTCIKNTNATAPGVCCLATLLDKESCLKLNGTTSCSQCDSTCVSLKDKSLCCLTRDATKCSMEKLTSAITKVDFPCSTQLTPLKSNTSSIASGCSALSDLLGCLAKTFLNTDDTNAIASCKADLAAELREDQNAYSAFMAYLSQKQIKIEIPNFNYSLCQGIGPNMCTVSDVINVIYTGNLTCVPELTPLFNATTTVANGCSAFKEGLACLAEAYLKRTNGSTANTLSCQADLYMQLRQEKAYNDLLGFIKGYGFQIAIPNFHLRLCQESWNTPCVQGGMAPVAACSNACDDTTKCQSGYACCTQRCNNGNDARKCAPDLRKCANITAILQHAFDCVTFFEGVIEGISFDVYCRKLWGGLQCMADKMMGAGTPYSGECMKRMAMYLQLSPTVVTDQLKQLQLDVSISQEEYAMNSSRCPENPIISEAVPNRPGNESVCASPSLVVSYFTSSVCKPLENTNVNDRNCKAFSDMLECIADAVVRDMDQAGDSKLQRHRCVDTITQLVSDVPQVLRKLLGGNSGQFDPKECAVLETVCGTGNGPLEGHMCGAKHTCPSGYRCVDKYCCPEEKSGVCPNYAGKRPPCNARCQTDSECGSEEKCCNVGCNGGSTCMPAASHNFSNCEREFENAKQLLILSGECGDGTSVLWIPKCEKNRFAPKQGDLVKSRFYCVNENGDKIPGSDHSDARDCTKVHAGKCPAKPAVCANKMQPDIYRCRDDSDCAASKRCCMAQETDVCIASCVVAKEADDTVPEDCANPVCCPITLCQDQVCAADVTATCRIHSCGECSVKFYNKDGLVDCEAGVPKCKAHRIAARLANAKTKKTAGQRLGAFINSHLRQSAGPSADMGEDMRTGSDVMETEADLLGRLQEDPELGHQFNERVVPKVDQFCSLLNKFAPCQHGNCSLGDPSRSVWQLCTCEPGYYGLLCEKNDTETNKYQSTSPCARDKYNIDAIRSLLKTVQTTRLSIVVSMYVQIHGAAIRYLPEIACGGATEFNSTQRALLLPDRGTYISYCSNRTTGSSIPNTMVLAAEGAASLDKPDCSVTIQQDPFSLPRRCLFRKRQDCASSNCGYFYALASRMCVKGSPTSQSFGTLTECYETCSFSYNCDALNICTYMSSSPKPCQDASGKPTCDYRKQFCDVNENTNMTQTGTCRGFPAYCLLEKHAGYNVTGEDKVPAYYYNATSRRCERFVYLGMGGNNNRFSSLHQCHAECGARTYKYDDVSCPLPELLTTSYPEIQENVCDEDSGCPDGQVCCSNGMFRVCSSPVKSCIGGGRCSLEGACDRGQCMCPTCEDVTSSPVCGTDGKTYNNQCVLRRQACMLMASITVASYGACSREVCNDKQCKEYERCINNTCACSSACTKEYEPKCAVVPGRNIKRQFGNMCHLTMVACVTRTRYVVIRNGTCDLKPSVTCETACPLDYDPVCVLYPPPSGSQVTLPNMCHVYKCSENDTTPQVLYRGECQGQCGANQVECPKYQQCVNATCGCQRACTKELRPVCAHVYNLPEVRTTFPNECEMRRVGCEQGKYYFIVKFGPCEKPAPKSECPATRPDVPHSYSFSCRVDTNAFCDKETEVCCPYGAGTRCVPKSGLAVKKEIKVGFCPRLSFLSYDKADCHSDLCRQDGDCAGTGKCCMNAVCGHPTCAAPETPQPETSQSTVCGSNLTAIPEVECDPSVNASSCPVGSACKKARVGEEIVGVCCSEMAADMTYDQEIRARQALCRLLEVLGIGCPEGKKCIGDLRGGRICGVDNASICSVALVQCLADPCQTSACPNFSTAKCTANYCGGCNAVYTVDDRDITHLCNATRCQNERSFYEELYKAVLADTADTDTVRDVNVFADHMRMVLWAQNVKNIPANGTVVCDNDGNYRPYQYYMDKQAAAHKFCVNTKTGIPYGRPDPELQCDEHDNVSRPEICLEKPDLTGTCDDSETERFYYNPDTTSCEMYIDRGCDVMAPNSFSDLVACSSVCGGYGRSSPCACATGSHCLVYNGSASCKALGEHNGVGLLEPVCDKDGKFMKRQCFHGVCACVDPETGNVSNDTHCNRELPVGQGNNNVDWSPCGAGISKKRVYCPNSGDGCNGCQVRQNMTSRPYEQCTNCQKCNVKTLKACDAKCKATSVCKERPYAVCRINKCNCSEEFVENGKVVTNCEKAQSKCEMRKAALEVQSKQSEMKGNKKPDVQYRCGKTGSFEVMCQSGSCRCLNATSGEPVGPEMGAEIDTIDCSETQKKTKPKLVKVRLTVAKNKKLADFTAEARQKIIDQIKQEMEKKAPGSKVTVELRAGSILADVIVESTGQSDAEGVDINSAAESFIAEANNNGIELTVNGETFSTETGTAALTEIVVGEGPVTQRPPGGGDDDDNHKTKIIIIVVVVVGVSALIAIGIGVCCYRKAKNKELPFSNIDGKSNPAYDPKA